MPKTPINYEKTIIYQIVCKDITITDKYVGHTTNFTNRKRDHKKACYNIKNNTYVYTIIRQNGGWENWDMIMIEEISVANVNEAKKIERHWIETLQATLNKKLPGRTMPEYRITYNENNKDKISEQNKIYRENNKNTIKEMKQLYYQNNKDRISEQKKIYRENNKNRIKERKQLYYQNNKDRISEQNKIHYQNKKLQKENISVREPLDPIIIP